MDPVIPLNILFLNTDAVYEASLNYKSSVNASLSVVLFSSGEVQLGLSLHLVILH
jgi:hypothetical protein